MTPMATAGMLTMKRKIRSSAIGLFLRVFIPSPPHAHLLPIPEPTKQKKARTPEGIRAFFIGAVVSANRVLEAAATTASSSAAGVIGRRNEQDEQDEDDQKHHR